MAARPTTTAVAEEGHTRRRLAVTFPPAIVTRCAEQVFCFGGDGHTGATRPSTAWRFLRAASTGATATAPPTASWPRSPSTSTTSPPPEPLRPVPTERST